MIIIEGPDGAGKTHLIKGLSERYQLPIAERVVSKGAEPLTALAEWVERENAIGFQEKLYDRHRLISNPIYSPILGKATHPQFSNLPWVMSQTRLLYALKPIIIYCLPPLEVVRENVFTGDENIVVQDRINQIYEAYVARSAVDYANPSVFSTVYDYTTDGQEDNPLAMFDHVIPLRLEIAKSLS